MEDDRGMMDGLEEEIDGGWITTYADLVTLLLVFFVLLFSISSLNLARFKHVAASIMASLGETESAMDLWKMLRATDELDRKISLENLTGLQSSSEQIRERMQSFVDKKGLGDHVVLTFEGGKIVIRVKGHILFDSGSADLAPGAAPILDQLALILSNYTEYDVSIQGHTDDIPISTALYPSNWELSAVRATTVLKYLIGKGVSPYRMSASGYGSVLPLVPNDTPDNRATNRRVEFVLEKKTPQL